MEVEKEGKEVEYEVEVSADGKILEVEEENDDDNEENVKKKVLH